MALCPEAAERAAMIDAEFWEHVLQPGGIGRDDYDPDDDPHVPDDTELRILDPCPECGVAGACAYDAEGRPMIHVIETED